MAFRRTLAAATLALTTACATTSQVKPVPVATNEVPAPAPAAPEPSRDAKGEKDSVPRQLFAQAVAAFDAGDYEKAEKGFREVLEKAPQSLNAQFNLGVIAERQGRLADAQEAYEKVRFLDAAHVPTPVPSNASGEVQP